MEDGKPVVRPEATDPPLRQVQRALRRSRYQPDSLIEVLHVAQNAYGFLSEEVLHYVARAMHLPESQVFGVATFYHFFSLQPKGLHDCTVCTGTVCHIKGAGGLVASLEETFALRAGQTSPDGKLSLGTARCLGNCTLAPMLTLDGRVLGHAAPAATACRIRELLDAAGEKQGTSRGTEPGDGA